MANKAYFEPVDIKIDFPEMERKLLDEWYDKGIVNKYLEKNKNSEKYFSFLDGPITANNPMGVHHAWGRTYKDLWQKYKNMQGLRERFQNGFDCQGLWVEVEVEKELGFKSKKDIENLVAGNIKESIAKFVNLCKERVVKYAAIQTQQSKRLGYFMDWDHSYYTLSDDNNYMIWHFLKKCHEKGLIYKGHDVVPWCPRCETAISEHEILSEDYKEVTHDSIYLKFPLVDKKGEFLLIWTTTPWTIPANIAVAVDEKLDYSLVEDKTGQKFWVARQLVKSVISEETKTIKTVKGKELVGLKYEAPFDSLPVNTKALKDYPNKMHTVIATDDLLMPISTEEGTGLVHTSTGTGQEDFKVGKLRGLPVIPAIDDEANYLNGYGEFAGKNAKNHPEIIFDYLKENGDFLFRILPYTHRYPACWRCKTELVWKVADEWYIAMDKTPIRIGKTPELKNSKTQNSTLREQMIEVAKKITWLPDFGLGRELDWLRNMHDWLISKKNRYWGLALPIWECPKCKHFEVIGSYAELQEKAVEGWNKFEGNSPHKPWIDEVKIKCPKCGEVMARIPDVGNPWLDAGIVSLSTITENNQGEPLYLTNRKEWEKWFPADFITESFPGQFKNWFYSLIAMSTVLEDKEPSKTILGFATLLGEDGRPMHKSWGNAIPFNEGADKIGVDVMRWMYARQNPSENLLFGYKVADETRRRFHLRLWNVYNFFVTYANLDKWKPINQLTNQPINQSTVLDKWILSRLNQTVKEVSDYLEKYDAYLASGSIESFVDDLSLWYIRRSRDRVGPSVESSSDKEAFYNTCHLSLVTLSLLLAPFTPFLAEIIYRNLTKEESIHLTDWPAFTEITARQAQVIEEMQHVREMVEIAHSERKLAGIPVRQPLQSIKVVSGSEKPSEEVLEIAKDELNIKVLEWEKGAELKVELDTKLTPELEEEANTRELVRKIQEERKNLGMNLDQRVVVTSPWIPVSKENVNWILRKTLAEKLSVGEFSVEKAD